MHFLVKAVSARTLSQYHQNLHTEPPQTLAQYLVFAGTVPRVHNTVPLVHTALYFRPTHCPADTPRLYAQDTPGHETAQVHQRLEAEAAPCGTAANGAFKVEPRHAFVMQVFASLYFQVGLLPNLLLGSPECFLINSTFRKNSPLLSPPEMSYWATGGPWLRS